MPGGPLPVIEERSEESDTNTPAAAAAAVAAAENSPATKLRKQNVSRRIRRFYQQRFAGNATKPLLLCDRSFTTEIVRKKATLDAVTVTETGEGRGEGTYGIAQSAEIRVRADGVRMSCAAIVKTARDPDEPLEKTGIQTDVLRELSTYNRIRGAKHLAKCLYAKITSAQQRYIMEHYVMDLSKFRRKLGYGIPDARRVEFGRAAIYQILKGLEELHAAKMIHKDLKPANILIGHDGRIMLTDYGLTIYRMAGVTTPTQAVDDTRTTDWYEPPEANHASHGKPFYRGISEKYDIWSLGVIAYEFLGPTDTTHDTFGFYGEAGMIPATMTSPTRPLDPVEPGYPAVRLGHRWRSIVTEAHYRGSIEFITVHALREGARGLDRHGADCIKRMLEYSPLDRPTATELLAHPWFADMTVPKSMEILRQLIAKAAVAPTRNASLTQQQRAQIQASTLRKGAAGAAANAAVAEYFPLMQSPDADRLFRTPNTTSSKGKSITTRMLLIALDWLFETAAEYRLDGYRMLHAVELLLRYCSLEKVANPRDLYAIVTMCFLLAIELSPFYYAYVSIDDDGIPITTAFANRPYTGDELLATQVKIIKTLRGDLYPVENGLVARTYAALHAAPATRHKSLFVMTLLAAMSIRSSVTMDEVIRVAERWSIVAGGGNPSGGGNPHEEEALRLFRYEGFLDRLPHIKSALAVAANTDPRKRKLYTYFMEPPAGVDISSKLPVLLKNMDARLSKSVETFLKV